MSKVKDELKNDPLMPLRHSAEHILHMSVEILFPETQKVMGPAIENGFYGDFDTTSKISQEDLDRIEKKMSEIIKADLPIKMKHTSVEEAKKIFKDNKYKLEMISDIEKSGEEVGICEIGSKGSDYYDVDLCAGPHVNNTSEITTFKLLSIAGAYWRGDEKNKMLTRIYGTAFDSKEKLEKHLEQLKEIKKRDHRKIGKDLRLFMSSEEIGPGLPLWLPNGMIIREELEKWGKETELKWGYKRVSTPFMTKRKLLEISGHIPYFEDEMYKVSVPGDKDAEYFIKPMNCPFHHIIYKSKPRSYRELPLKLAEYGTVARYENRGALNGILRPRLFCQNDAHVYCSEEQAVDVFVEIIDLHRYYYDSLGLKNYYISLCLRDPTNKDKYHGDAEMWKKSEELSRQAMDKAKIDYTVENEGAAHYGPKMDFKIKSAIGTEYGISTNQIDLYMPKRFGLTYIGKDGKEKPVIVQHRAPLGSSERFVGVLIEHFAGEFPVWLSPQQIVIIPVSDKYIEYANKIAKKLLDSGLRIGVNRKDESLGLKIRNAQISKTPYMFIVGEKEEKANSVSVRLRNGKDLGIKKTDEVAEKITQVYLTKKLELW